MESFFIPVAVIVLLFLISSASSELNSDSDAEALLLLKHDIDPFDSLPWRRGGSVCSGWKGVKDCTGSDRVSKLVVENLNLTGMLRSDILAPLDQLRVLSFKSNSLSGPIPDLTPLVNLKSLYLSHNHFSGEIPSSLSTLHRLKIIVLCGNRLSGRIPPSFADIPRLYALLLEDNRLTGTIPGFRQPGLNYFNVSYNDLAGEIPRTKTLDRFSVSSFLDIPRLCGDRIQKPCSMPPASSPDLLSFSVSRNKGSKKRIIRIIVAAAAGGLVLLIGICAITTLALRKKKEKQNVDGNNNNNNNVSAPVGQQAQVQAQERDAKTTGFSWEDEGLGKLVFCGRVGEMYNLEDLLKASAETLGRGTTGSTYKAVMESGFIVTVKRLKDSSHLDAAEFRRRMEELGRLRHPNLVPLRAYFQAKEERLLVYDYFPNGSLFSLIHGSRPSGSGKPLHWTSCLKIAEDVATGLLSLHESNGVHGNLKSSNVLLGPDFESCLTDFGLLSVLQPSEDSSATTTSSASLYYRAPECRNNPFFTPQSDIYSFGVLLLELLTGKTPYQDLVEEHGADIPRWVQSVREEETESTGDESSEEKLGVLVNIAMACVVAEVEKRPGTKNVVKMIRDARAEVVLSSNSSDHSPGRWSDTVQSLPREYGSEHLSFAERN